MAWFVSRRNCQSFLTTNTVAGPLDGPPRSGRATGNHQNPPAPVLLSRRTAHPLGAPPHPASSPALALGGPVQSRPGPAACPATPNLTAPVRHRPDVRPTERPRQLAPSRSATASCCVLSRHFGHHRHCRPPSAPPKSAYRPPANLLSTRIPARIIAPITPSPPFHCSHAVLPSPSVDSGLGECWND